MGTTVFAILGLEHSGTTLLSRLLAAATGGVGIGGLKNVPAFVREGRPCSCGEAFGACPFWSSVDTRLKAAGTDMTTIAAALETARKDPARASEAARHLVSAVAAENGDGCVVESSRSAFWPNLLASDPEMRLVPVHVFKTPEQQMASAKRKGRSTRAELAKYIRRNTACHMARVGDRPAIPVPYPDLSADPESAIGAILAAAGLPFDPASLLGWNDLSHHMLGGNRMLRSGDSTVTGDQSWQTRLNGPEKLMGRLLGTRTYRRCGGR